MFIGAKNTPKDRSYTDPGFYRAFDRLFGQLLQGLYNLQIQSPHFYWAIVAAGDPNGRPHLMLHSYPHTTIKEKVALTQLGTKLFKTLVIHIVLNPGFIYHIKESIRNNYNFVWDCTGIPGGQTFPVDFLCAARNISVDIDSTSDTHSEQHVFDMIVHKLKETNNTRGNVNVQIYMTQAGTGDFSVITRACHRSSFRGKICWKVQPQTNVTEGVFGSLRIDVVDNTTIYNLMLIHDAVRSGFDPGRFVVIESI